MCGSHCQGHSTLSSNQVSSTRSHQLSILSLQILKKLLNLSLQSGIFSHPIVMNPDAQFEPDPPLTTEQVKQNKIKQKHLANTRNQRAFQVLTNSYQITSQLFFLFQSKFILNFIIVYTSLVLSVSLLCSCSFLPFPVCFLLTLNTWCLTRASRIKSRIIRVPQEALCEVGTNALWLQSPRSLTVFSPLQHSCLSLSPINVFLAQNFALAVCTSWNWTRKRETTLTVVLKERKI